MDQPQEPENKELVAPLGHQGWPQRDLTPAVYDWIVDPASTDPTEPVEDGIAPETRIAAGPAPETGSTSASIRFAGSDNITMGLDLTFECRLDSDLESAWEPCTTPMTYRTLDYGSHTFEVRAVDGKLNVDPIPAVHEWTVLPPPSDVTSPETSINSTPDGITVQTNATFTFSTDDPVASLECALDGGTEPLYEPCTSPKQYTTLSVGEHVFRVRAKDPAGNVDATPATFTWQVGRAPVPGQIYCGMVVKQSIVVKNDLADCVWDGLIVGAPTATRSTARASRRASATTATTTSRSRTARSSSSTGASC
jgi:hypothetical protein